MIEINKFIKIGILAILSSISIVALSKETPLNEDKISSLNLSSQKNNFNVEQFRLKYSLDLTHINIQFLNLSNGLDLDWFDAVSIQNKKGSVDIVILLDDNGNLYNIDKYFKNEYKLSIEEKNHC